MEISQRRFSNRINYVFDEQRLHYSVQDSTGSRSFTLGYGQIHRDRQTLTERSQWLRNVGVLWMALGAVLTLVRLLDQHSFVPSFWLGVGLLCYVAYRCTVTSYLIIPSEKGNLLVIDNADGQRIVEQIESRRAQYLRSEYDFLADHEEPEQRRNRFRWLHREGALSDQELEQRLCEVDAKDPAVLLVRQVLLDNQLH
jgi:hypothetical protein